MIIKIDNEKQSNIYIDADDAFVAKTATSIDQDIRCRSLGRRGCRNGNVTWCVDVYHPMENIEACFSEGLLINATEAALGLDLPSYFEVTITLLL